MQWVGKKTMRDVDSAHTRATKHSITSWRVINPRQPINSLALFWLRMLEMNVSELGSTSLDIRWGLSEKMLPKSPSVPFISSCRLNNSLSSFKDANTASRYRRIPIWTLVSLLHLVILTRVFKKYFWRAYWVLATVLEWIPLDHRWASRKLDFTLHHFLEVNMG